MPLVSVIIPNYNHARFLERRIQSVLSQTLNDIEIILLDDASTDDSSQVLARYEGHPKIRIFRNSQNSGSACRQWNKGVGLSSATYVWIAEADDFAEPNFLSVLVPRLELNPKAVLAYCQSWIVDTNDQRLGDLTEWTDDLDPQRWRQDFTANGREECANYLIVKNTIPNASAVVFRRDAFVRSGSAHEEMRLCGDWLTWSRLILEGEVVYVFQHLNHFRRHSASVRATTSAYQNVVESLQVSRFIGERVQISSCAYKRASAEILTAWWCALRHSPPASNNFSVLRIALNSVKLGLMMPAKFLMMIPAASLARSSWMEPFLRFKRRFQ